MFDPTGPVLGIDPGVSRCGYGAVTRIGSEITAVSYGVITTSPSDPLPLRLAQLAAELDDLVAELAPPRWRWNECCSRTTPAPRSRWARRADSRWSPRREGIPVEQYSPNEVKLAVAGHGGADKEQVQLMVTRLLRLGEVPRPPDAADALALALCHEWSGPLRDRTAATGLAGPAAESRVSGLDRAVAAAIARDAR